MQAPGTGAADHRRDGDRGAAGPRAGRPNTPTSCRSIGRRRSSPGKGSQLDRSTLCDWVGRACWWLEPLWRLLHRHVMSSTRIFADDTSLPVLDPGRGRTKTGRLWGYAIDDRPWQRQHPAGGGLFLRRGPQGRAPGQRTWPSSRACCRWTAMAASSACWRTAYRARSASPSAGRIAEGASTSSTGPPARRWRKRRCAGSASSTGSRPRSAAAPPRSGARSGRSVASRSSTPCTPGSRSSWGGSRALHPGRGDPLRPAPLAGAGAVPRGRPARARHQHHRAGDPADRLGPQECPSLLGRAGSSAAIIHPAAGASLPSVVGAMAATPCRQ